MSSCTGSPMQSSRRHSVFRARGGHPADWWMRPGCVRGAPVRQSMGPVVVHRRHGSSGGADGETKHRASSSKRNCSRIITAHPVLLRRQRAMSRVRPRRSRPRCRVAQPGSSWLVCPECDALGSGREAGVDELASTRGLPGASRLGLDDVHQVDDAYDRLTDRSSDSGSLEAWIAWRPRSKRYPGRTSCRAGSAGGRRTTGRWRSGTARRTHSRAPSTTCCGCSRSGRATGCWTWAPGRGGAPHCSPT